MCYKHVSGLVQASPQRAVSKTLSGALATKDRAAKITCQAKAKAKAKATANAKAKADGKTKKEERSAVAADKSDRVDLQWRQLIN